MKGKVKTMTQIRSIIQRLKLGQSQRQIQRELGIHRTIIRSVQELSLTQHWLDSEVPMPSNEEITDKWSKKAKDRSHPLDRYKGQLEAWNNEGLSSVVIHQLLKDKCTCDVQVIRRYRAKYFPAPIDPIMVRSTTPGGDLELDFGELGRFRDDAGVIKRVWLFSLRLRHSRQAHREIVLDQTLSTFLKGHINAFEYFQGVPKKCIPDNLKAAVTRSTTDNDMINRSYQELAEHYGFIIAPCAPRTPEHKGGVEGDVKYVKRNFIAYFLADQKRLNVEIPSINDLKSALESWCREVADKRVIYGVGRTPLEIFNSEEQIALNPLPKIRWEQTSWRQCNVRRDWRIMVDGAFYSVPHQLIGKMVQVCVTDSLVRIFFESKEAALHDRTTKKWDYKRKSEHAPPFKEAVLQCTREGLIDLSEAIGPFTNQMTKEILSHPSVDKLKPVRCLLNLKESYSVIDLELACQRALTCKLFSYSSVKSILEKKLQTEALENSVAKETFPIEPPRFARNPSDYKTTYSSSETFEEKLIRFHPVSTSGSAMMGAYEALMADQITQEAVL